MKDLVDFYSYVAKLKRLKRAGWKKEKIRNGESVSDHSFSTAILAMILAPKLRVDREKFVKMALIHDIGESIIGDILWYDRNLGVDKERLAKKQKDEDKAMEKILMKLSDRKEYMSLWKEMAEMKTKTAKLLKEIDRLDLAMQAFFYEKSRRKNLLPFFEFVDMYIHHPILKKVMSELKSRRKLPKAETFVGRNLVTS